MTIQSSETYAMYYCPNPWSPRSSRQWVFLTSVEGYPMALRACRLLRERGMTPRGIRVDPAAMITPPPEQKEAAA